MSGGAEGPDRDSQSRCLVALSTIARLLPALDEALAPGSTPPSMRNVPPGEDQVAAYRAERAERHLLRAKYLPESAPPADLDVVMAIADIKTILTSAHHEALRAAGLPERCRRCNHLLKEHGGPRGARCGLCEPCPGFGMTYLPPGDRRRWESLLVATASSDDAMDVIEGMILKARDITERALSERETGWLLLVPCPWCHGKNRAMPGGSLTLRVYLPGARAVDAYVLCLNPACDPDRDACGSRRRGRPMWRAHELGWLSDRLDDEFARLAEARCEDVA